MTSKTRIEGDQCLCWSPYHPKFPKAAKKAGGSWVPERKAWSFPASQEGRVIDICLDFFGDCNGISKDDSIARREMAIKERDLLLVRLRQLDKYLDETEIPNELQDND